MWLYTTPQSYDFFLKLARISGESFEKSYSNCMVETGRKPILSLLPSKGVEFAPFEIRVIQLIQKPKISQLYRIRYNLKRII